MRREIDPQKLLVQAERLALGPGGRGQPRNVDLRRAASVSYYALFHRITLYVAERLVPAAQREHQLRIVRSVDHGSVAHLCRLVLKIKGAPGSSHYRPIVDDLASDVRLADICQAFLELQQRRHEADYDHLADFSRPDTLALVSTARRAIRELGHCSSTARGQMFFLLIAMQSGLGR